MEVLALDGLAIGWGRQGGPDFVVAALPLRPLAYGKRWYCPMCKAKYRTRWGIFNEFALRRTSRI